MDNDKKIPKKSVPTLFPSGFTFRISDRGIVVLDFCDIDYDDNANIVGSFALDKTMLVDLQKKLQMLISDMEQIKK